MTDAHAFVPLKRATSYSRTPPNIFNLRSPTSDLLANFNTMVAQRGVDCPVEGVFHLERCYVYEAKHVLLPTLEWLDESVLDLGIRDVLKPVLRDVVTAAHHRTLSGRPPRETVVIAKAGADNYGHVLADILPKLINIKRAGFKAIHLLLPSAMRNFVQLIEDMLTYLGISVEIELVDTAVLFEARDVYFFSPVSCHDSRKSTTFLELRDVLAARYQLRFEATQRLYVRRGETDSRKLVNAQAVQSAFEARGFKAVFPPALCIQDQMRLFASASHVAGALGAGLANIAFAPSGCEIMMIDPGLGDYYFWDFSCLLQQRFNWFFAGPLLGYSPELSLADFAVDPAALGAWLTTPGILPEP